MPICDNNTILVGLGGTGGLILRAFKMRIFEEFPSAEQRSKLPLSILYVDSTRELMPVDGRPRPDFRVLGQDASFTESEFLNIKTRDVGRLLNEIEAYSALCGLVDNVASVRNTIGNIGEAAGQMRRAGRVLFASNADAYVSKLRAAYARCQKISSDGNSCQIYIFAGLCGGTGSGAIIDAIVQSRKTFPDAVISVIAMIPEMNLPKPEMDKGRYYQNGYAALAELNALQSDRFHPHDVTGNGEQAHLFDCRWPGVANGITLYSNVNENGVVLDSLTELPKIVSDYIFARVFLIHQEAGDKAREIIRGYTYENITPANSLEKDELAVPTPNQEIPAARTKKINAFGIKRVMYPELRVLNHTTYTVGEAVLRQLKYNNWRDEVGYDDEPIRMDRHSLYKDTMSSKWLLDRQHMTLDSKILPSDTADLKIAAYWEQESQNWAQSPDIAKGGDPLNDLSNELAVCFNERFANGNGVEKFYKDKYQAIPDMVAEIRSRIERDLFADWTGGKIAASDLRDVCQLVLKKVDELKDDINHEIVANRKKEAEIKADCDANVNEWKNLSLAQRIINKGNRIFAVHQGDVADLYTARTMAVALQFAQKLSLSLGSSLEEMQIDINNFVNLISNAIKSTEKLIGAQRKQNKGLEDMSGAIIEVSEGEEMERFEKYILTNQDKMRTLSRQIRDAILPSERLFVNFGRLTKEISIDSITEAFDKILPNQIKEIHNEMAKSRPRILGLNILSQLMQKLPTDEDINSFASKIMRQSGVYLSLDTQEIAREVPNNDYPTPVAKAASINQKVIYVGMPSPGTDEALIRFVRKLEEAFNAGVRSESGTQPQVAIDTTSPRQNELMVISLTYSFPMRCITWLADYSKRYKNFLNTPNAMVNQNNRILLHSEGDGTQLPSLFVVSRHERAAAAPPTVVPPIATAPPSMPTLTPTIQLYVAVNNQPTGPYDWQQCQQLVASGQLKPESLVWQNGMAAWTAASGVPLLQPLFAQTMPPIPGAVPPII